MEALATEKIKYRNRLFNQVVTLWAFLSQVLDADKSCSNAVSRVMAWLSSAGSELPSADTGSYCKARARLPENVLLRLLGQTALGLEAKASGDQLWCGRHVQILDGSSVSMPDTKENQTAYPQHSNQAPGCGFPSTKILVMFSLVTGAAMGVLSDALNTSDVTLARRLYSTLKPGDVALADRAFGTYVDLVLVQSQQVDAVFRQHQSRRSDFRRGKKLGIADHIVTWNKPKRRPPSMSVEAFAQLTNCVKVREVHFLIAQFFLPRQF